MGDTQRVSVGSGTQVEVRTAGAGEVLLLIQTALLPQEVAALGEHQTIADRYRIVDMRRRDYGLTGPAGGPGSVLRDAQDCQAVLQSLGIDRAHVVGASYSAAVALELLALDPGRVASLTVMEPPPVVGPHAADFLASLTRLVQTFEEQGARSALEAFGLELDGSSWVTDLGTTPAEQVAAVERDATAFFVADLPALLGWHPDASRLGGHDVPCLYVGGADTQPWFRDQGVWVAGLFPRCEVHLVPGADHGLVVTHTSIVAQLLAGFLAKLTHNGSPTDV